MIGPLAGWRSGDGPLASRLAAALEAAARRGELLPGARLPPERLLGAQLGVGRATVGAAYELLRRRGLVERRQGRGTEVVSGGGLAGGRSAELATSLQRNVVFRSLGEPAAGAIELLGSSSPPAPAVREAMAAAVAGLDLDRLTADHGYAPLGHPPLRAAIAAYLTRIGQPTGEDEVLVTTGAQQAIGLVATGCVAPGQLVVLEDPTFPGAIDAFRTAGARILTVAVGEAGADLELLATTLTENPVAAAYLMPSFHNPTGAVMPEAARRELARLGRATGVPIVEDDALAALGLGHRAPPPVGSLAGAGAVLSIGSLSKLFWGGLRVGWIRAPRATIAQLGPLKAVADLGSALPSQAIAVRLLADAERLTDLRLRSLGDRLGLLLDLLQRRLPDWRWRRPAGGLSVWARLPTGSAIELAPVAARHGVSILPGSVLSPSGAFEDFVRLPFDHTEEVLDEATRRLGRAWDEYRALAGRRLGVVV